ncbi:hypothetical protein V6N13_138675 [Hibiscus sabdariffa]|uniref:Pectinesterase catalytic domain-containing protein n=1 Tax=Hibiscus sabdariffa TaxID=183260 RepID=A0ABR2PJH7_9ROSI
MGLPRWMSHEEHRPLNQDEDGVMPIPNIYGKKHRIQKHRRARQTSSRTARVSADKPIFINCRFEGFQDTLYAHTHRQFYRNCVIIDTVDFIFGDAAAVFQDCTIYVRKPNAKQKNIITAQGRKDKPWKQYSRIVIMGSLIEDLMDPAGWLEWEGDFALNTLFYGEFNNTGPGAKTQVE